MRLYYYSFSFSLSLSLACLLSLLKFDFATLFSITQCCAAAVVRHGSDLIKQASVTSTSADELSNTYSCRHRLRC